MSWKICLPVLQNHRSADLTYLKDTLLNRIRGLRYVYSLWTPAKSMLCFANVIFYFFYGRLMLRHRLTEVRETFTRGGPWVWTEKLLLGFFLVLLKLQGGPKSDEIWPIFRPHPQTFCSHARMRQNIVILKKKLVKHRWLLLYSNATFGELWPTNPWDPRDTKFFKKNDTRE